MPGILLFARLTVLMDVWIRFCFEGFGEEMVNELIKLLRVRSDC